MSDDFDLYSLKPLLDQILFGTTDPEATPEGGIMAACGLDEDHVVEDDDPGDRPTGMFITYKVMDSSDALYGQQIEDYVAVEDDPDDEDGCVLVYDNARTVALRIAVHAPADDYTADEARSIARLAQRHLNSIANRELLLLGMDAYILNPGRIRNATTVLNESIERVFAFDAQLVVQERYTVPTGTFDKVSMSIQALPGGEEEEEEIT